MGRDVVISFARKHGADERAALPREAQQRLTEGRSLSLREIRARLAGNAATEVIQDPECRYAIECGDFVPREPSADLAHRPRIEQIADRHVHGSTVARGVPAETR